MGKSEFERPSRSKLTVENPVKLDTSVGDALGIANNAKKGEGFPSTLTFSPYYRFNKLPTYRSSSLAQTGQ